MSAAGQAADAATAARAFRGRRRPKLLTFNPTKLNGTPKGRSSASEARKHLGVKKTMARGGRRRILSAVLTCLVLLSAACGGRQAAGPAGGGGTDGAGREVTVYVSTDRVFSEPVLRAYERKAGVKVNAVYDTEETKSTGLANKLLAEKNRPQADVFWSNEPVRTLVLKKNGVLAPYRSPSAEVIPATFKDPEGYSTGFSARSSPTSA